MSGSRSEIAGPIDAGSGSMPLVAPVAMSVPAPMTATYSAPYHSRFQPGWPSEKKSPSEAGVATGGVVVGGVVVGGVVGVVGVVVVGVVAVGAGVAVGGGGVGVVVVVVGGGGVGGGACAAMAATTTAAIIMR